MLESGAIGIARSLTPGNLTEVDKTIEIELMKWLESSCGAGGAGITGLLTNEGAYQRWIIGASERAKYYTDMMQMCGSLILRVMQVGSIGRPHLLIYNAQNLPPSEHCLLYLAT